MEDYVDILYSSGSGDMENQSTLTCTAASLERANGTDLPPPVLLTSRVLQILYGLVLVFGGGCLNFLVMFLIGYHKNLWTVSFSIAFQLSLSNFITSFSVGVPLIVNHSIGRWIFSSELCVANGFILFTFTNLRLYLVLIFGLNLFFFVLTPFYYRRYSYRVATIMCLLVWCLGIAFSVVIVPGLLDCYVMAEPVLLCFYSQVCKGCEIFRYIYYLAYIAPLVIPIFLFTALYVKGRAIRRKRNKITKNRTFSWSQEWKALTTFIVLLVALCLVSLISPVLIIISRTVLEGIASDVLSIFSTHLVLSLVLTDPIILLTNRNIYEALKTSKKKLLSFKTRWNHRNTLVHNISAVQTNIQQESAL